MGPQSMPERREGEIALPEDPATMRPDAGVVFIGRIRSPWTSREDCPKNMAAARMLDRQAVVEIDPAYRAGLQGLEGTSHVVVLSWLGRSPRNLIVQKPRHASAPKGVFALRSPARPNPIGLHVAGLVALDAAAGLLTLDAIDVLDGTPVVDLKPYFASIDSFPQAVPPRHRDAP
jgi:tRNA-Thr(GGU) m(6)t(6)A37 methyltransferase TsaA